MRILWILWEIVVGSGELLLALSAVVLQWSPLIIWIAWWTFGVNWRTTREWLRQGAWAPLVLLMHSGRHAGGGDPGEAAAAAH